MKWGVRRKRNTLTNTKVIRSKRAADNERREQMKAIAKRKDIARSDRKLARYGSMSRGRRMVNNVTRAAMEEALISQTFKREMNPKRITNKALDNMAIKELQLRSLSKKYNQDGSGEGSKSSIINRERAIATAYKIGAPAAERALGKMGSTLISKMDERKMSTGVKVTTSLGEGVLLKSVKELKK